MKAIDDNKPAAYPVSPDDVKKGDVLLSCGWGNLSTAICLLDGGDYSHAGICVGVNANGMPLVVEATKKGVVANQLKDDMAVQKYIDLYRFKADTGDTFGSPGWPPEPVLDRAHYYKDRGTDFAYNQLLLMGMLVLVRKAPVGKLGQAKIRYWLAKFIKHFKPNVTSGKENVTCSELTYRCFYEADANGKYGLDIAGTLHPDGHVIKKFATKAIPANMGLDQETISLFEEATEVLMQIRPKLHRNLNHALGSGNNITIMAANPNVCADMVTPYDMQKSPNLERIGRLKRKPIRSWLRHLMNCCSTSSRSI